VTTGVRLVPLCGPHAATDPDFDMFGAFDDWSSHGGNYTGEDNCRKLWDTMPPKEGGIKAGSLVKAALDAGYKGPIDGTPGSEVFSGATAGTQPDGKPSNTKGDASVSTLKLIFGTFRR